MEFKTEIGIDLKKPPPLVEIEYGRPPSTIIDFLCSAHIEGLLIKNRHDPNILVYRYQQVIKIKEADEGRNCRICSYTRGIPK